MKIIKVLHFLSHLKWLFGVWMIFLIFFIFINQPDNMIQLTGTAIFISGIMMGFASLSDTTKISAKEKKDLSNQKVSKRLLIFFLVIILLVGLISILFLFLRFIKPETDKSLLNDFTKLGYDGLVMMLGLLCLMKQLADKVKYVQSLDYD